MTKLTEFLEKGLAQSATTSNEMSIIFKIKYIYIYQYKSQLILLKCLITFLVIN